MPATLRDLPANPVWILDAVLAQLRTELTLNASTCFLSFDIAPQLPTSGLRYVVVTPTFGPFTDEIWTGAGRAISEVDATLTVTGHCKQEKDEAGRDYYLLTDSSYGILPFAREVLDALCDFDPENPTDATRLLLRQPMRPRDIQCQRSPEGRARGEFSVNFQVLFAWKLDP